MVIFDVVVKMVCLGGCLVYVMCSLLIVENDVIIVVFFVSYFEFMLILVFVVFVKYGIVFEGDYLCLLLY